MEITVIVISALLVLSLASNGYLILKIKKKPTNLSLEARDLLNEMLSSSAVVEIKVLDKSAFFLRSPRG